MNIVLGFLWGLISSLIPGVFAPVAYPLLIDLIGIEGVIVSESTSLILENIKLLHPTLAMGNDVVTVNKAESLYEQGLSIVAVKEGALEVSSGFFFASFLLWTALAGGVSIKLEWQSVMFIGIPLVILLWIIQIYKSENRLTALIILISLVIVSWQLGERGGSKTMIILSSSLFSIPFYLNWIIRLFSFNNYKVNHNKKEIYQWEEGGRGYNDKHGGALLLGIISTVFIGLPPSIIANTFYNTDELQGFRLYKVVEGAAKASSMILALEGLSRKDAAAEYLYINGGLDLWILFKLLLGINILMVLLYGLLVRLIPFYQNYYGLFIDNPVMLIIGAGLTLYNISSIHLGMELIPIFCIGYVIGLLRNVEGSLKLAGISLMPYISLLPR
jgi:hypothetical protein